MAGAAVRELLREAWADDGIEAVLAHTLAEPNASTRVLERAGFTRDGVLTHSDAELWRWRVARPRTPLNRTAGARSR